MTLSQRCQGGDPGYHAEGAVKTTAGVLTIDVRTCDDQGLLAIAAVQVSPDVADRIALDPEASLLHPRGHLILGSDPLRAVNEPSNAGFAIGPVRREFL